MANMPRRSPEPPPGLPRIQYPPGTANEVLRELAPLLAEEGNDIANLDVDDLETLQAALTRAVERRNTARFARSGEAHEYALATLRLVAEALAHGDVRDGAWLAELIGLLDLSSWPPGMRVDGAVLLGAIGPLKSGRRPRCLRSRSAA